jgi:hypothetical protein
MAPAPGVSSDSGVKVTVHIVAWAALLVAVVYFTVGARHALLFENPLAMVGIGLIGLGLCMDARRGRLPTQNPPPAEQ